MTIDEAILKYKEITNTDAICPAHCNISCDKCVQESKQLAEWLEELKALRNGLNIKCDSLNEALEKGKKIGYNKAIDDFANVLKENYDYLPQILSQEAFGRYIDEYEERLKEGVGNGTDNQ